MSLSIFSKEKEPKPETETPDTSHGEDLYVLLDINNDGVVKTGAMYRNQLMDVVMDRFAAQPLEYFNQNGSLKIVNLRTKVVKNVRLTIEL
jgi:hypothetical protein